MKLNHFLVRAFASGMLMLAGTATAADLDINRAMSFRIAAYSIPVAATADNESYTVEWSYPVFQDAHPARVRPINAWLRRMSLSPLVSPDELEATLKMTDRAVIKMLASDPDYSETGHLQSAITPERALGAYRTFHLNVEERGRTRSQHGVDNYVYDLKKEHAVSVESLFKPQAADALASLLAEKIERLDPACAQRKFEWPYASVFSPDRVTLEFPFHPAQWDLCGEGIYNLNGAALRKLLVSPSALTPARDMTVLH